MSFEAELERLRFQGLGVPFVPFFLALEAVVRALSPEAFCPPPELQRKDEWLKRNSLEREKESLIFLAFVGRLGGVSGFMAPVNSRKIFDPTGRLC